jgi:hypothetical protein
MRKRSDPVLPDQGGRAMPADPLNPVSTCHEELVRQKAYEIYEQRGRERGREIDHWLAAEQELTTVQRKSLHSLHVQ